MTVGIPVSARASSTVRSRRFGGLALFVAGLLAVEKLRTIPAFHSLIRFLFAYSPKRLVHGAMWTLPLSAFITAQPRALGTNTIVSFVALAPYVLLIGALPALRTYLVGHIVATLLAAIAIVVAVALGVHGSLALFHATDTGISAGLAAVGGALVVLLARRGRRLVPVVLAVGLFLLFTHRILVEGPTRFLSDCEHLVALSTGAALELRLGVTGRELEVRCSTSE